MRHGNLQNIYLKLCEIIKSKLFKEKRNKFEVLLYGARVKRVF